MNLSFSTNAFIRHSLADSIKAIGAIGYRGVEILADVPHLFAMTAKEQEIDRIIEAMESAGVEPVNLNANTARGYNKGIMEDPLFEPALSDPDPETRKWRVAYSKKCIDLAARLGSPNISITSGTIKPGSTPEEAMRCFRESLAEITDHAVKKKVRVGLEYEPGLLVEYCMEAASIIEEMKSPLLGVNLDVGHSHILGEDPDEVLKALSGKVFHVHIEDIRDRQHLHLIPGQGDMDFDAIMTAFKKNGYKGYFTVELYTYPDRPEEAARKSFEYLTALEDMERSRV